MISRFKNVNNFHKVECKMKLLGGDIFVITVCILCHFYVSKCSIVVSSISHPSIKDQIPNVTNYFKTKIDHSLWAE